MLYFSVMIDIHGVVVFSIFMTQIEKIVYFPDQRNQKYC